MNKRFDVIIIGSGASGTSVALPLVKAGLIVGMIDGGIEPKSTTDWPSNSFETIRKTNWHQRYLFFGNDLSGLISPKDTQLSHLTSGYRSYITSQTEKLLPLTYDGLEIIQSLAMGGQSEAWTGACDIFSDAELLAAGLPSLKVIHKYYLSVIDRIGVSGISKNFKLLPPVKPDHNARILLGEAKKNNRYLQKNGIFVERALLAVLTRERNGRRAVRYSDMHFWSNQGESLYHPRITLDLLKKYSNFYYHPNFVVESVNELTKDKVVVQAKSINYSKGKHLFSGRVVVLAAGSPNTSRILLKSYRLYGVKLPFLTKESVHVPFLNLRTLGKKGDVDRISFAQLLIRAIDNGITSSYCLLHSYKSLLYYRLLPYIPIPVPQAFSLLSIIGPAIIIADARFPAKMSKYSYLQLIKRGEKDTLQISSRPDKKNKDINHGSLKRILSCLRKMKTLPIKVVTSTYGSTAHYAGGVPFSNNHNEYPLSVDGDGKLHRSNSLYIADASTWRFLPAQHPTLTIMANAERIGEIIVKKLKENN